MFHIKWAHGLLSVLFLVNSALAAQDSSPVPAWLRKHSDGEALACRFAVEPIFSSPLLRIAKLDARMPEHIAPSQFLAIGAAQVLIHAQESVGATTKPGHALSWAAVARLREPLDINELIERWCGARIVPNRDATRVDVLTIDDRTCYRVPSGTFLGRPVRSGFVEFEDSKGNSADGINIGDVDTYYSFVGDEGKIRAVVTFDSVTDKDLVQGNLQLALRCPVFQTRFRHFEDAKLSMFVRNPKTGRRTESFEISLTPDHEVRFVLPGRLKLHENPTSPLLDLQDDLIADEQLQLCFSLTEPSVYCGFGDHSVQIVHDRHEFLHLENDLVFVSDSQKLLEDLLDDKTSIQGLLTQTEATAEFSVRLTSPHENHLLERFAIAECEMIKFAEVLSGLTQVEGTLNLTDGLQFQSTCRYATPATAAAQISPFIELIVERWTNFRSEADLLCRRSTSIGRLVQSVFDGVRATFPKKGMSAEESASFMSSFVGGPEDVPRVALKDSGIEISFARPAFHASDRSREADFLANVFAAASFDLVRDRHIEQAENSIRLALEQMPDDLGLILRLAHLYCFNAPRERHAAEIRYAMVRKGIHLVLDPLERTGKDSDKFWLLARILRMKVADPLHEAGRLQPLFESDSELQERLQKVCEFRSADAGWDADPSAIAKRLLTMAIRHRESTQQTGEVPRILLYSDRAHAAVSYAENLMRSGEFSAAETAWRKASDYFGDFADDPLVEVNQKTYRLFDLPDIRKTNAADVERIELEYDRTECMLGFSICDVATNPIFRESLTTIHEAKKLANSHSSGLEMYEKPFQKLASVFEKQDEQIAVARLLAPEWQDYEHRRIRLNRPEVDSTKELRRMLQLNRSFYEYRLSRIQQLLKNQGQRDR